MIRVPKPAVAAVNQRLCNTMASIAMNTNTYPSSAELNESNLIELSFDFRGPKAARCAWW